jgi:chromosome segregation ATPase
MTPSKKDLQSMISATPCSVKRMRGNFKSNNTFVSDKISQCFDSAFSITDEKVNTILQSLKVKSKWDIKEKSKKQEAVIKDLKDSLLTMLNESKKLKDNCVSQEHQINGTVNELQSELRRTHDDLAILRENEIRFKKEILKKTDDISKLNDSLDQVKREKSPIRSRAENSERKLNELYEKFNAEKSSHIDTQATCEKLERELVQLRKDTTNNSQSVKDQNDQMKEEVSTLKNELKDRQTNLERYTNEKINLDKTIAELKEELIKSQSSLRESETLSRNHERDTDRLKMELDMVRSQLSQKDLDMRSTLTSLQESQARMAEDKSELRAELSICKSRLQSLEDERLVSAAQVATKNEELQSAIREVTQLRELVNSLESKLTTKDSELLLAKEASMQLEVERELRSRCEVREEAERRERIAACAQLLATQTDSYKKLQELETKTSETIEALKAEVVAISSQRDLCSEEIRRQGDIIMVIIFHYLYILLVLILILILGITK